MQIGVRQSLVFLTVSGLFVTMSPIGAGLSFVEKRNILANTPINGEQPCRPGEIRIAAYPADFDSRLAAYVAGALIECPAIFIILMPFLILSISRIVNRPGSVRNARGNHEMRNVSDLLDAVRALGRI